MKKSCKSIYVLCLLLTAFLVFFGLTWAQQTGFSGVVTDSQGRAIPNAKVEVKRTGGYSFFATTNDRGRYVVPKHHGGGVYRQRSLTRFATVETKILLLVGQLATFDLTLPIASTSSNVVVEAGNDLAIDTTSSAVAAFLCVGSGGREVRS